MNEIVIRNGSESDLKAVHDLIIELAIYEKAPNEVETTVESMRKDAFSSKLFSFIVAEQNNEIMGLALYYYRYSTWKGKCLFLEDLVVSEEHRRKGIGSLLMDEMIAISKKEKVSRLMWQVLDWNQPAIDFYKKYDAIIEPEWLNCKIIDFS